MTIDSNIPAGFDPANEMILGMGDEESILEEEYNRQLAQLQEWLIETIEENPEIEIPCYRDAIEQMIGRKKTERRNITGADRPAEVTNPSFEDGV
jgi:hypothetical protein